MKLGQVIQEKCVELGAELRDRDAVLRRAAELAVQHRALEVCVVETIYRALKAREAIGSTGFGKGIAIPHCRIKETTEFVVGMISVPGGVDFDSIDGEPVKLVLFIVGPEEQSHLHIRLLSEISRALGIPGAMETVMECKSPAEAVLALVNYGPDDVSGKGEERRMLQVVIQDEGAFQDVFEAVAGIDPTSIAVVEARTAEEHLAHIPLFAGLWDGRHREFCKIIVAFIGANLVNETVRRIEQAVGRLDERSGVVVAVHQLFYLAGRLAS